MRNYEFRFKLKEKSFLASLLRLDNSIQTVVIPASSEKEAKQRLKMMYSDKDVHIIACRIV